MLVRVIKKKKKKRLTALVNREMQIETRARHHPTPSRTARMKKTEAGTGEDVEETGIQIKTCAWMFTAAETWDWPERLSGDERAHTRRPARTGDITPPRGAARRGPSPCRGRASSTRRSARRRTRKATWRVTAFM